MVQKAKNMAGCSNDLTFALKFNDNDVLPLFPFAVWSKNRGRRRTITENNNCASKHDQGALFSTLESQHFRGEGACDMHVLR